MARIFPAAAGHNPENYVGLLAMSLLQPNCRCWSAKPSPEFTRLQALRARKNQASTSNRAPGESESEQPKTPWTFGSTMVRNKNILAQATFSGNAGGAEPPTQIWPFGRFSALICFYMGITTD